MEAASPIHLILTRFIRRAHWMDEQTEARNAHEALRSHGGKRLFQAARSYIAPSTYLPAYRPSGWFVFSKIKVFGRYGVS